MKADMGIPHFALEFGPRHQRRHRVDDQNVDRARAHQRIRNFKRLLTSVRLGNQQFVNVHAKLARIDRVKRVFGIDKRTIAAVLLRLSHRMQRQRRLARGFGAIDLDDPALGESPDAKPDIEPERSGRDRLNIDHRLALAKLHHRALAKRLFNLANGSFKRLGLVIILHFQVHHDSSHVSPPSCTAAEPCPCGNSPWGNSPRERLRSGGHRLSRARMIQIRTGHLYGYNSVNRRHPMTMR